MNRFGRRLVLTLWGASHGPAVGALVDGMPAGIRLDEARIAAEMAERRPGGPLASRRHEPDAIEWRGGVLDGITTGDPIAIEIRNVDARSGDYPDLHRTPRPGHADYPAHVASPAADLRGGGHASGRLTAPIVAAGAIAQHLLDAHDVDVAAHLHRIGDAVGPGAPLSFTAMQHRPDPAIPSAHAAPFAQAIEAARRDRDSVGGEIDFVTTPLPAGLGAPFFGAIESDIAAFMMAIPAVRGIQFGAGFAAARMRGSEHNDPYQVDAEGHVTTTTNHHAGVLGGRTSGMPIWGRVAIKPTATIPRPQQTVDLETGLPTELTVTGRHDPCIALRAVPVVRAAVRWVLADHVLGGR